jgi:hypothetical protein
LIVVVMEVSEMVLNVGGLPTHFEATPQRSAQGRRVRSTRSS